MIRPKVFVIGAGGMVGATAASALAFKEVAHDIILIDIAEELADAHATDINHATAYTSGVHVRKGDYDDIAEGDIIVITCGVAQKPGQTRLDLLTTNVHIIKDVVGKIKQQGKLVPIVMVSNPVDVLTYVATKEAGLPKGRVFGTGTTLDTARLRVTLANTLDVSQQHMHGYVLGEHGDSSFPALSAMTIAGIPVADFPGYKPEMTESIDEDIRAAAYRIVAAKTASKYGIGQVVAQLVEALMRDSKAIYPVCSLAHGEYGLHDVVLGLPHTVSAQGVSILDNYPLSTEEQQKLAASAEVVEAAIKSVGY